MTTVRARRALLGDGWHHDVALHHCDGEITAIESAGGRHDHHTVTAGFVDLQVNGLAGVDVACAAESDWELIDTALVGHGVTTWCPTLISQPLSSYGPWLDRLAAARTRPAPAASIAGAHLEGPFLGDAVGMHAHHVGGPVDRDWIDDLDPASVAIVTLGPERPGALEAIAVLRSKGIVAALGHTTASYEQTMAAVDAGATLFTHCYNASGELHHRRPGAIGAALSADDLTVSLIVDGIHVHPAMVAIAWRAKPRGRLILVSDSAAWSAQTLDGRRVEVHDGAPRLADGTLAGSELTLDQAVRTAVDECGIDLADALRAASAAPAGLLGLHDRGEVRVGARADLVSLDERNQVVATWVAGHLRA